MSQLSAPIGTMRREDPFMLRRRAYVWLLIALTCASVTWFKAPAYAQAPATEPAKPDPGNAAAQGPTGSKPQNKAVAKGRRPEDLENELAAVKAENAAIREQLRRMEEQQKALLALVEALQLRLDAFPIAGTPPSGGAAPPGPSATAPSQVPPPESPAPPTAVVETSVTAISPPVQTEPKPERYQDGIVIWRNPEGAGEETTAARVEFDQICTTCRLGCQPHMHPVSGLRVNQPLAIKRDYLRAFAPKPE
jgi:hypothetical protein